MGQSSFTRFSYDLINVNDLFCQFIDSPGGSIYPTVQSDGVWNESFRRPEAEMSRILRTGAQVCEQSRQVCPGRITSEKNVLRIETALLFIFEST